jgi:hypothetical protein
MPVLAEAQLWPHVPQLLESVSVSTHVPLQSICPVGQHSPLEHAMEGPHTLPQEPQWRGSESVFTQAPPQSVNPARQ